MEIEKIVPKDGPSIEEVKKYIDKYKNELIVIKYGGNVFIDRNIFNNFISDISILNKLGLSIIIVHGGGPRIKRELEKSNIQSKFIRGLRVTDEKIINIVENVLIDFNEDIVNSLIEKGSKAISLNTKKNNVIEVIPEAEELGFVGKPNRINTNIIKDILKVSSVPIISPLGLDKNDKEKKLITEFTSSEILEMINNEIITEGMIPKINTCLDAVMNGVTGVGIIDGRKKHSILFELFSDKGAGTLIRK